jgi:hypothetical protein
MRVTFIGHASLLIEANGLSILSDPWWNGPCFGAQWWPYPLPHTEPVRGRRVDFIYISHGHHDHFHPPTLRRLDRATRVLVAAKSELAGAIKELGFEVVEIGADREHALSHGVTCRILPTYADDTLMVVSDGTETCLNLNDALHATPVAVRRHFCRLLRKLYPKLDYVFCGYGTASHFPNCYVIPGKDRELTAARRQAHFNRAWAEIIRNLEPRFGFPFAADVAFLDDALFWSNEPVHNSERPIQAFERARRKRSRTRVFDIAPGFVIADGQVVVGRLRQPLSSERLARDYANDLRRVNRVAPVEAAAVEEVRALLEENIRRCLHYLRGYARDYRCLIELRGAELGIEVTKRGESIAVLSTPVGRRRPQGYDLVYRTRIAYLRQSLTTTYGHETLFVGSGGIFEYLDRATARSGLHREIMVMLRPADQAPPARVGGRAGMLGMARRVARRLLGRAGQDLYDLERWTVFRSGLEDRA